ncbi:hypothetical protein ACJMK2_017608 [Sinanodonta woodiana]|uniref:Rho guanine nucleotide exchange factor 7 n=1 Tax=Sinanodonta woodiana TaxID=1069815 RepID=A0ABD3UB71_SINWO
MASYKKPSLKSPSTEFSDEIVNIVNEINDFVAVLEARQAEFAAGLPLRPLEQSSSPLMTLEYLESRFDHSKTDSGADFQSDSRSESQSDSRSDSRSDQSKSDYHRDSLIDSGGISFIDPVKSSEFDQDKFSCWERDSIEVEENHYEPIANILPGYALCTKVTATATATIIHPQKPVDSPTRKPSPPPKPPGLTKMVDPGQPPRRFQALHNFRATNNDELCISKGDIITMTQMIDGGWWEGTLNGKTGWFPSNYVREIKPELPCAVVSKVQDPKPNRESMQYYHNVVLQNVIETERTHVQEMTHVLQTYIRPILTAGILSTSDFAKLTGNLEDIITFQQKFLISIEECSKHPPQQRRVGGVFMKHAPTMKDLYLAYCANHPEAVAVLQKHRDDLSKFLESLGASPPGSMTVTTNLSKPFTRLDKYPSLLKELERHIEESHVDRGDTQRAIAVYRDIANSCMEKRKLKEMEYEIITSTIKEWEGEEITKLGEVVHLSQVSVHKNGEKQDRIFVLFPNVLLMLSMSPRLSGYQYEGKIPISGMTVTPLEDSEEGLQNSIEISGSMIEKMVITCGTRMELNAWLECLKKNLSPSQVPSNQTTSSTISKPITMQQLDQPIQVSTSQPSISTVTKAKTATVSVTHSLCNFKVNKPWNMSCLRPAPPLRPPLLYRDDGLRSPRAGRKLGRRKPERTMSQDEYDYRWKRYDPRTNEEDALILKVVEAYCTSAKTRHTVNSCKVQDNKSVSFEKRGYSNPYLSLSIQQPEEEKIIVDDGGDPATVQEKSLVDTVYSLRDQVKSLETEHKKLRRDLDKEQEARRNLESIVNKYFKVRHLSSQVIDGKIDESIS